MVSSLIPLAAGLALVVGAQSVSTAGFIDPRPSLSAGSKAECITGIVPVKATSPMNIHLKMAIPENQTMVTQGFLEFVSANSGYPSSVIGSTTTVSGTYKISASLCYPKSSGIDSSAVHVLTHGIGFDHYYWDFAPGYSYVDVAAENGYTTFSYDRLGVGDSAKPDPIQVVQSPLEAEILHELVTMLRGGKISDTKFKSVVGIGHSFGSAITTGVAGSYPSDLDAAVLTGFSVNMSALPVFLSALNLNIARHQDHLRFYDLNNGYLVSKDIIGNQYDFFYFPGYPPENLRLAELTKGTVTLGELLTMTAVAKPAKKFTGPIAVVNGLHDLPFCLGDCSFPSNQAAAVKPALFPNSKGKSMTYLAAAAGHGLNMHYSAGDAFSKIMSFLKANGM